MNVIRASYLKGPNNRIAQMISFAGFHSCTNLYAGHSKWANIRHDKAKNDAKRSREAYSMANQITNSVKSGGVEGNAQLITLIEKAKKLNVTKKIIENAIKRGTGEITSDKPMSDVMYEFIGPGGVAFIIEASTDSKTRTIGLVKHAMSKFNASLNPCHYMFEKKGWVIFAPKNESETLDDLLDVAIDVGAEDIEEFKDLDDEYRGEKLFRVFTESSDLIEVVNNLSKMGYKLKDSSTGYLALSESEVPFPKEHEKGLNKALELLDDIPEITNYYSNIKEED